MTAERFAKIRPGSELSFRERQIAQLAAKGYTNDQIANVVRVSTESVRDSLRIVRRKLGLKNKAEVAAWAAVNPQIGPSAVDL